MFPELTQISFTHPSVGIFLSEKISFSPRKWIIKRTQSSCIQDDGINTSAFLSRLVKHGRNDTSVFGTIFNSNDISVIILSLCFHSSVFHRFKRGSFFFQIWFFPNCCSVSTTVWMHKLDANETLRKSLMVNTQKGYVMFWRNPASKTLENWNCTATYRTSHKTSKRDEEDTQALQEKWGRIH